MNPCVYTYTCIFRVWFDVACMDGFHGRDCASPCRYPNFGWRCRSICDCRHTDCHHVYGCRRNPFGKDTIIILFLCFAFLYHLAFLLELTPCVCNNRLWTRKARRVLPSALSLPKLWIWMSVVLLLWWRVLRSF
jgi:hypothetical protein